MLADPSTGLSCFFYRLPQGDEIHGVATELAMGQQGDDFFVEILEFIG